MSNGHVELHHLSADGAILANLDLGPAWSAYRAAANRTTALIAVQRSKPGENERSDWSSVLVDLTRNAIVRTIPNARPVYREQSFMTDPGEALSDGEIVPALDPMGRIIRVNMNTGAVTPLPR